MSYALRGERKKLMAKKSKCPKGGGNFRMGYDGTVDGCDKCLSVKRDKNGYAWGKRERVHTYTPVETADDKSTWVKVTRAEAFGERA